MTPPKSAAIVPPLTYLFPASQAKCLEVKLQW